MRSRPASVVAWSVCAFTLLAAAVAGVLAISVAGTDWGAILPEAAPPTEGVLLSALDVGWLVAFAGIGALVASNRPSNPVGWFLVAIPATLVFNYLGESYYWYAAKEDPRAPGDLAELALWFADVSWVPAVILVLVLLPLHFPTGRPPTPRWRLVAWTGVAGGAALLAGSALSPGPLENYDWVDNPLGVADVPAALAPIGVALWLGSALAAAVSVVVRFRRARGPERAQLTGSPPPLRSSWPCSSSRSRSLR